MAEIPSIQEAVLTSPRLHKANLFTSSFSDGPGNSNNDGVLIFQVGGTLILENLTAPWQALGQRPVLEREHGKCNIKVAWPLALIGMLVLLRLILRVLVVVVVAVIGCWLLVGELVVGGSVVCGCLLSVVCSLLFAVRCLLFFVCCLLFVVCCSLFAVCCSLFVVRCLLFVVRCLLFVVCCVLCCVCCVLCCVCCVLFAVCTL